MLQLRPAPDLQLARAPDEHTHSSPPPTLEEPLGGRACHESPGHTGPMTRVQSSEAMEAGMAYSDEDYEEDIIEPRPLNEITTMTDKTSPWSSLVSETSEILSPQPDEVPREGPSCPSPEPCSREELKVKSSFLSHPEKAVPPHLAGQGAASLRPPSSDSKAANARLGDPGLASPAQQSNTFKGRSPSRAAEDREPEPEAQLENTAASSELSDSVESFEKLSLHLASPRLRGNHQGPPVSASDIQWKPAASGAEGSTRQSLLYPLTSPTVIP